MKKFKIILLFALPVLLSSCLFDEEDFFDKSASERIEASKVEAKAVLEGAENGWHVRYFPSPTQEFGGYNVFFKFADGKVTIASETEQDTATAETSLYSMGEDLGVTVNFDTQNSVINYFVHPRNPEGLGSTHKGMEGDYKFTVVSATPNEVRLRGIISGNTYILTPVAADVVWATELDTYKLNAEDMTFGSYTFTVGGQSYPTKLTNRRFTVDLDAETTIYAPFIYTKEGISFYQPITINGITAQDFRLVDEYYFTEVNGADFKIMTPKPIVSDNTFSVTVPAETRTYNSVTVKVTPTIDTEYFYITSMLKSEFDAVREKELLRNLVATLNANLGSGDDPEVIAQTLLYKGVSDYTVTSPSFYDENVAVVFGVAINNGAFVSTTPVTSLPFSVDSSLLPDDTPDWYKKWLGKWAVTSTSSEKNKTSYTFYITIKPEEIGAKYKIRGWGYTTYANKVDIVATCDANGFYLTQQELKDCRTPNGWLNLRNRYVNRETGDGFGILNSSNAKNLAATYSAEENGKAELVGRDGSLTSGVKFTITMLEFYESREGTTSSYYLTQAPGYTYQDFFMGPYTMTQLVDADGNTVHPDPAN